MDSIPMVYVAGPVSNIDGYNREAFDSAEMEIIRLGYRACNPQLIGDGVFDRFHAMKKDPTWFDFMRACIPRLAVCDAIYMLPGWRESRGARMERLIAKYAFGMPVFESMDDICFAPVEYM